MTKPFNRKTCETEQQMLTQEGSGIGSNHVGNATHHKGTALTLNDPIDAHSADIGSHLEANESLTSCEESKSHSFAHLYINF